MDSNRISSDRPFSDNEKTTLPPQKVGRKRSFFFYLSRSSFARKTRKRHVIRLLGNLFLPRIFHDVNRARVCGTHPLPLSASPFGFCLRFSPVVISPSRTEEHDCLIFPRRGISYSSFSRRLTRSRYHGYDTTECCNFCVNCLEIHSRVYLYLSFPLYLSLSLSLETTIFYFFPFEVSSMSFDRERGMISRRRSNGPKERERRRRCDSSE